ncbi:MAG: hypothetical protein DRO05_06150 [Thermoproteota archaeon]|nr:MAG: hypothetical protein DRO05_06150 [Candidatus Korarchaeota archaeon]
MVSLVLLHLLPVTGDEKIQEPGRGNDRIREDIWLSHNLDDADWDIGQGDEDIFLAITVREKGYSPKVCAYFREEIDVDKLDRNKNGKFEDREDRAVVFHRFWDPGSDRGVKQLRLTCDSVNPFEIEIRLWEMDEYDGIIGFIRKIISSAEIFKKAKDGKVDPRNM